MEHMIDDICEVMLAVVLSAPMYIAPGYVIGSFLNILSFREKPLWERLLLSPVLSIAVWPIASYLLWYVGGEVSVFGVLAACVILCTVHIIRHHAGADGSKYVLRGVIVAALWVIIALIFVVDIQWGQSLYPVQLYDYYKHVVVVDAVSRTGISPVNPVYHPGEDILLKYYYFWHIGCALVDRMGGDLVSPRTAFFGGIIWSGLTLMAAVASQFLLQGGDTRKRRALIAVGMLTVLGIDVLPTLYYVVTGEVHSTSHWLYIAEHWNADGQVCAWFNAVVWAPHHVMSVVAFLAGFLVLQRTVSRPVPFGGDTIRAVVFVALACASGSGMSVWVALVAVLFFVMYAAYAFFRREYSSLAILVAVGLLAAAVSVPFLLELAAGEHLSRNVLAFSVRSFYPSDSLLRVYGVYDIHIRDAVRFLLLPLNYAMEFGFILFGSAIYIVRRIRTGRFSVEDHFWAILFLVSLLLTTFLRSAIRMNDFGFRGTMFAQYVLLIWSVDMVDVFLTDIRNRGVSLRQAVARPKIALAALLLVIGFCTTAYDIAGRKIFHIADQSETMARGNLEMVSILKRVEEVLPDDAVVMSNPENTLVLFSSLYLHRQRVLSLIDQVDIYGISRDDYRSLADILRPVFAGGISADSVRATCTNLGVDYLITGPKDSVWNAEDAWTSRSRPLIDSRHIRVYEARAIASAE